MKRQKLVSVIVPVYKVSELLLRKSIESILSQSYQNLELILVDDGSPDQCGKICEAYLQVDKRIKVIHKKNGGVSSARNCGIEVATGDYIFFMDSDDCVKHNAIELLYEIAEEMKSDITICSCNHVKESNDTNTENAGAQRCIITENATGAIRNLSYNIQVFDELETTAAWGKLYKRETIGKIRFNEGMNIAEDFVFNYFVNLNAERVAYCNLKLYDYIFVETSLMHNNTYSHSTICSFEELVAFEKSQRESVYANDIIARCINIAFTMYLKIPKERTEEIERIERYIMQNRKSILKNHMVSRKVKVAVLISCISFGLVRNLFYRLNSRRD